MKTLFVIGNGFDLAHGLKTSYGHFKKYIERKYPDIYERIDKQIFIGDGNLWSEFEKHVGTKDDYFIKAFEDSVDEAQWVSENTTPGVSPMDGDVSIQLFNQTIGLENEISEAVSKRYKKSKFEELYQLFIDYIEELLKAADVANYAAWENDIIKNLFKSSTSSKFITFNYTHTLEHTYSKEHEDILYIHGEIGSNGEILFGNDPDNITELDSEDYYAKDTEYEEHKKNLEEWNNASKEDRQNYPPPEPNFDYSVSTAPRTIDCSEYVEAYNDAKNEWIKELDTKTFEEFIKEETFEKVIVLGHSFGEVDCDYFELIDQYFPDALWEVSFYKHGSGISSTQKNFKNLFPQKKVKYFPLG